MNNFCGAGLIMMVGIARSTPLSLNEVAPLYGVMGEGRVRVILVSHAF